MTVREALDVLATGDTVVSVDDVRKLVGRPVSRNAVSKAAAILGLRANYGRTGGYYRWPRAITSGRGDLHEQVPDGAPARSTPAGGERSHT